MDGLYTKEAVNQMKFNIFFRIRGTVGEMEIPNTTNPIEAENITDVLEKLVTHWVPDNALICTVGIRIECIK